MRATLLASTTLLLTGAFFLPSAPAHAASWCAYPLWVHEWGVQAFDDAGQRVMPVNLPAYFHRDASGARPHSSPVRHEPPDPGIRALPVLHFYSAGSLSGRGLVPVGIEVGFTRGDASAWFPQVHTRRTHAQASSPAARRARTELERAREARQPFGTPLPALPPDPTRQLVWDRLTLSASPANARPAHHTPWVDTLRGFDRALWVNTARESERFVFYESNSRETVPLRIVRGETYANGRRHYVLQNTGSHAVHDVFVTHCERGRDYVFYAPSIPAGRSAAFVMEEHRVTRRRAATRDRLRGLLIDAAQPAPPTEYRWGHGPGECVMMIDPAVPVETAEGHRLYAHEVDAILGIWSRTFFDQRGTTITYREDAAYLDAMMPLSIHTEMTTFAKLRRLGLAVWRPSLP